MADGVPGWVPEWRRANALARKQGKAPIPADHFATYHTFEPESSLGSAPVGITPRRRKKAVVYEARHRGRYLGVRGTIHEAVDLLAQVQQDPRT